jgi:hypothetical protein
LCGGFCSVLATVGAWLGVAAFAVPTDAKVASDTAITAPETVAFILGVKSVPFDSTNLIRLSLRSVQIQS